MSKNSSSPSLTDIVLGAVVILMLLWIAIVAWVKVFDSRPKSDELTAKVVAGTESTVAVECEWVVEGGSAELIHPPTGQTRNAEEYLAMTKLHGPQEWVLQVTPHFQLLNSNNPVLQLSARKRQDTATEPELAEFKQFFDTYYSAKTARDDDAKKKVLARCSHLLQTAPSLPDRIADQDKRAVNVKEYLNYRLLFIQQELDPTPDNKVKLDDAVKRVTGDISGPLIRLDQAARGAADLKKLEESSKLWRDVESETKSVDDELVAQSAKARFSHKNISAYRVLCNDYVRLRAAKEHLGSEVPSFIKGATAELLVAAGETDPLLQILRIETERVFVTKKKVTLRVEVKVGVGESVKDEASREVGPTDDGIKRRVATIVFPADKSAPTIKMEWGDN